MNLLFIGGSKKTGSVKRRSHPINDLQVLKLFMAVFASFIGHIIT